MTRASVGGKEMIVYRGDNAREDSSAHGQRDNGEWDRRSLCAGWTVRDGAAHLTLVDIVVHGRDIAVPLSRDLAVPVDTAATAATRV